MKLSDSFITYRNGDEQMMVSMDTDAFSGMVRSNKTAAFIIDCLTENVTREQLMDKLRDKYDADDERLQHGLDTVLNALRQIGALEE